MKNILTLFILVATLLPGCQNRKMETINSPLVTVIKVHSAETLLDFTEAKRYEDINRIYKNLLDSNANPEDIWREYKYFDYDIIEETEGKKAEVILNSKNLKAYLRAIIYKLELRESGWVVVGIEFRKNE